HTSARRSRMVNVGDVIAGKYKIERVLGEGGMGKVLAATHLVLGKPVAIKLMRREALGNREAVQRFLREARAAARLRSPHAVHIDDADELPSGEPYIVMEHLDGIDLAELCKQRGALPVGEAAMYVVQACVAIAEAHSHNIVHRDIKPGNLFLARGAGGVLCVKVLDFGIAKLGAPVLAGAPLASSQLMMGTP